MVFMSPQGRNFINSMVHLEVREQLLESLISTRWVVGIELRSSAWW